MGWAGCKPDSGARPVARLSGRQAHRIVGSAMMPMLSCMVAKKGGFRVAGKGSVFLARQRCWRWIACRRGQVKAPVCRSAKADRAMPDISSDMDGCIPPTALLMAAAYLRAARFSFLLMCGRGGTGRRATLRSLWAKARGSSSLLDRTRQSLNLRTGCFSASAGKPPCSARYQVCFPGMDRPQASPTDECLNADGEPAKRSR